MSRRLYNLSAVLVCVLGLPTTIAIAQQVQTGPEIINETHHDTSIPIRFLAAMATHPANKAVLPLHRRPGPSFVAREAVAAEETVQQFPMPEVATTPFQNFDGLRDRDGVAPPDANRRNAERIPTGSCVEFADCGHIVPWEKPEALLESVRSFLLGAARVPA